MSDTRAPVRPCPLGEPLMAAEDVAAFLAVDRATVYRLAGAPDGLPVVEIAPRVRRFRPEDVRAFVARRTHSAAPGRGKAARLLGGTR